MAHTVTTTEFEGPLALLLELVERHQLEVTEISLAALTADYLAKVRTLQDLDAEGLSEFLQLGARLLYIKSLALLPQESAAEQAQELVTLNTELAEYRRYQAAARQLGRLAARSSWTRPVVSRLAPHELPRPDLSLTQLAEAFERALRRTEPLRPRGVISQHLSQEHITERLMKRLQKGPFKLSDMLDQVRNRLEIVVTFLAVLELIKQGSLRVTQAGQFAPVMIEPSHA